MKNLTLSLVLVVIIGVVGVGWLINRVYLSVNETAEKDFLEYQLTGKKLASTLDLLADKRAFLNAWNESSLLDLSLMEMDQFPLPPELSYSFLEGEPLILRSETDFLIYFYLPESALVMSLLLPDQQHGSGAFSVNLVLTLVFYVGIVLVVLLWLYPLIRRLSVLRNSARAFGEGDLEARVGATRISYIADIETEFNYMADRIQNLLSDNKLLSRAVSHDLKTPLARLRFGVDTLVETERPDLQQKYIGRINDDLEEMESLVETLLQYARLDASYIELNEQKVNLNEYVMELFARHRDAHSSITMELSEEDNSVLADKNYLAMQLKNILSNALRFARSVVHIRVFTQGGNVIAQFEDDGKGFSAEELKRASQPFWRGEDHSGYKGHGMGLAIVERIAQWHKAKLHLSNSEEYGGAKVQIMFIKQK